jgi:ABC-type antimicrobial peptide transport system permease subunit
MILTAIGLAVGLTFSLAVTRFMKSLLLGIAPTDALTFSAVTMLLGAVAVMACLLPARRAMRLHPLVALRHE